LGSAAFTDVPGQPCHIRMASPKEVKARTARGNSQTPALLSFISIITLLLRRICPCFRTEGRVSCSFSLSESDLYGREAAAGRAQRGEPGPRVVEDFSVKQLIA
jgi:hypothetical protein